MKKPKNKICNKCRHASRFHYKSDYEETKGRVICGRDNCTAWNRCDQVGWDDSELLGKR